jgi:hypothetical protein
MSSQKTKKAYGIGAMLLYVWWMVSLWCVNQPLLAIAMFSHHHFACCNTIECIQNWLWCEWMLTWNEEGSPQARSQLSILVTKNIFHLKEGRNVSFQFNSNNFLCLFLMCTLCPWEIWFKVWCSLFVCTSSYKQKISASKFLVVMHVTYAMCISLRDSI